MDPTNLLLAYKTINKSFGSINFYGSSLASVVGAINSLVVVANATYTLNAISLNFALTGASLSPSSRLTYQGSSACPFKITCRCNLIVSGSNSQNVYSNLFYNGTIINQTKAGAFLQQNGTPQNNYHEAIMILNPNDYIELYVANASANNNITVSDCSISAVSLH